MPPSFFCGRVPEFRSGTGRSAPRSLYIPRSTERGCAMNDHERQLIDSLFARLRRVESQSPPRDPEAMRLIADHIRAQPAAAYYLAQTVIAQEQALESAQTRLTELERELYGRGGGGFLTSLAAAREHRHRSSPHQSYRAGPWPGPGGSRRYGYGAGVRTQGAGGGFLAGAAQTAVGVAGGMTVGHFIADAFLGDAASAAQSEVPPDRSHAANGTSPSPTDADWGGEEFPGGGFDFDEF